MIDQLNVLIDELCREINRAQSAEPWTDPVFFSWAERITALQGRHPKDGRAPTALDVNYLASLPASTTDVFRYSELRTFGPEHPITVEFKTSGTTARFRGRHALCRTDIYDNSALRAFELLVDPDHVLKRLISLVPPWEALPESSLSFMLSTFERKLFDDRASFVVGADGVDMDLLRRSILEAASPGAPPVLIFATTLAAQALLEADLTVRLPARSLILTTGGDKGRLTEADIHSTEIALAERFPGTRLGSEFGMTELLSQAYRFGADPFRLPPWCRVLVIDPATGERLPHGEIGLLRFVDLANVQSAVAVQTADLGRTTSDHTFSYEGRAPGARLRGCSLSFEELSGGSDE